MSTAATALITTHIPYLASQLRRYDGEINDLRHQREHLQSEIEQVKWSIQFKQKEVAGQIERKELHANANTNANSKGGSRATAAGSKRTRNTTRDEQENERPPLRRRVEGERRFLSKNADLRRTDSQVSMGARRRGRHFTNEEMRRATTINTNSSNHHNNKTTANANANA
ncbi:hypothetical protein R3P38DRAFT_3237829 [Favolaschia claudopus]|uniref:Uncharacterized protein n=1 Tax=Favolaschia claudopus TaxID=2862362 RepID=A0AAV9ZA77_9AGAR